MLLEERQFESYLLINIAVDGEKPQSFESKLPGWWLLTCLLTLDGWPASVDLLDIMDMRSMTAAGIPYSTT